MMTATPPAMTTDDAPEHDDALPEDAADVPDSTIQKQPSWWARLSGRSTDQDRLADLNMAIELYPDAPTAYMLRGELFLMRQEYYLAQADFETALTLAEAELAHDNWGLVQQSVIERALAGLHRTRPHTQDQA